MKYGVKLSDEKLEYEKIKEKVLSLYKRLARSFRQSSNPGLPDLADWIDSNMVEIKMLSGQAFFLKLKHHENKMGFDQHSQGNHAHLRREGLTPRYFRGNLSSGYSGYDVAHPLGGEAMWIFGNESDFSKILALRLTIFLL